MDDVSVDAQLGLLLTPDMLRSFKQWCSEHGLTYEAATHASAKMQSGSSPPKVVLTSGSAFSGWKMPESPETYEGWDEYTCPRKFHTYKMAPGEGLRFAFGFVATDNFRPFCFVEWMNGSFPTKMVKAGVDE